MTIHLNLIYFPGDQFQEKVHISYILNKLSLGGKRGGSGNYGNSRIRDFFLGNLTGFCLVLRYGSAGNCKLLLLPENFSRQSGHH